VTGSKDITSLEHVVRFEDVMWLIIVQGMVAHKASKAITVLAAKHESHLLWVSIYLCRESSLEEGEVGYIRRSALRIENTELFVEFQ
jgi:hypothetical protein